MKSRKLVIFIVVICVVLAVISLLSNRQPDDMDISSEAGSMTESMDSVPSEDSAVVSSEQSGSVEGQEAVNSQVPVESQVPAESVTSSENTPPLEETGSVVLPQGKDWGLYFLEAGCRPRGNESLEYLSEYNAYFCAEETDNVLYLTFDCGYENGNTGAILDALKKHDVKATFFVVGHYLNSAPDLVKRMVEEGHIVGNHSYHHPDMTQMGDKDSFLKELSDVEAKYEEITGQKMAKYFRPPQGKYNDRSLQMAEDLGYATFFWSVAYADWNQNSQPSHNKAFETLSKRTHPGAIVLLHNTSKTNGEILDEMLTKWEGMGYTFGTLEKFAGTDGTKAGE